MDAAETLIRDKTLKAWRFLYARGLIEGFGHISSRPPGSDQFLISRHSLGPKATSEDLLLFDMEGRKLSGKGDPPGEFPIHLEENAHRAYVSCALGKPVWLDDQTAAEAGEELLKTRGPFRRIWALVESDTED
ncbi:MAG: hypothetical protein A3F74_12965 [Betaproteobacteria bacterium RIFCSPLOWO2_12_FULL_62_58]|nr:MAG: hypothetical protein A3F74_12965 [Betaproteobacteria bacterium RIFCSPLOWO2_12_FULL_62_58]